VPPSTSTPPAPDLPGTKSPAAAFRELLQLNPAQRAEVLAQRPEHNRQFVEAQLREYEAMPAAQREARLRRLDLTYHLDVLMKMPPDRRGPWLGLVSPELRPIIDERLKQWDSLPADTQQDVLKHETTSNFFLRVRAEEPPEPVSSPPGSARHDYSRRIAEHLREFFDLPPKEQQKTLEALPPEEREDMERSLRRFAGLPGEQRRICIESFEKFSRMSKEQRDQFLRNAARWQAMSPQERETWRALVDILPAQLGSSAPPALPGKSGAGNGLATLSNAPSKQE
jgi:hypothetical protein